MSINPFKAERFVCVPDDEIGGLSGLIGETLQRLDQPFDAGHHRVGGVEAAAAAAAEHGDQAGAARAAGAAGRGAAGDAARGAALEGGDDVGKLGLRVDDAVLDALKEANQEESSQQ